MFTLVSLLIADDNKDFDINLFISIKKYNNKINILGISINGLDTYKKIKELKPDIVLLDIKMPILNGFQIIEKLVADNIVIPKIIIVTGNYELLSNFNHSNFIYGILFKPIDYCNLNKILNSIIQEKTLNKFNYEILKILSNFDFNKKSRGYKYLETSINACLIFPHLINNLEKNLYPYIAKQYNNSDPLKIKWAIEKSINSMNRYTVEKILKKFFRNSKKICTKYFIEEIISIINDNKVEDNI